MADDRLRIVASVDDQFSKPLEKLRGELANTARVPGLDDLRKRFSDIEGTITRLRQTGAQLNSVGGIGGMLGLGSLTGIASVAGLAASMRDLARTQVEMRHFSRETGIAAGQLKELQELGKRFQIAPEATTGALNSFAETMYDIRHGIGGMYGELRQKAPELAKDLRNSKDNVEALGHALGWLGRQGDTIEQKRWAEGLGLGPMTRLFTDGPKALQDAWRQIQASGIGKPNPELEKQSKALTDALNRFDTSVDTMKRTWAPGLLGEMASAVDKLSGSFGKFAEAYDKFRNGHPVDALKTIDEATDLGLGERKNAPASKPPTALDEQLDAQMRGQIAQSPAEKERADKIAAAEARLNKAREDLGYEQRRFPVKDEGAIKSLTEQMRQLNEELRRLRNDGATRQGVSFDGASAGGLGGLIQKASLGFPGGGGGGGSFGPGSSFGSGLQPFRRFQGGGGGGGDGGGIGKAQQGANASAVMAELKKAGYGDNAIAAVMGSMQTESGFRPGIRNASGHTGLWQWDKNHRWPKIEKWIRDQGGDPNSAAWQTRAWIAEHNAKPGDAIYDNATTARGGDILRNNPDLASAMRGVQLSERYDHEAGRGANARAWLPKVRGEDAGDLRVKGAETTAGGASASGLTTLLKRLQDGDLPGGLDRVTALNDAYHHRANPRSMHTKGLAGDITLRNARRSAQAAEAIRQQLRGAGLTDREFTVLDEYLHPSRHSTGGHIHTQFSTHEAAEKYRAHVEAQEKKRQQASADGRRPDILADPNDERRRARGAGSRPEDQPVAHEPTDYERWQAKKRDGLLKRARSAGVLGGSAGAAGGEQGHINGTIHLKGFPAGTRAEFNGGGIVKEVKLNRGSSMASTEA